ncbi:MAG: matrixin family metalloprotease [Thermoflexaceae bacterium]|nr:matrixin family metalloprotease [Thermoflexaceae bacterium]
MSKKSIVLAVLMIFLLFVITVPIYAAKGLYKLNGGVGDYGNNRRYYYIDSTCNSNVTAKIEEAWDDWTYTSITTPISTRLTTIKSQSVFDFYVDYSGAYSTLEGWTEYYVNPERQISPSIAVGVGVSNAENWDWTNIKLQSNNFFNMEERSFDVQKAVIAHEIGHAMGLVHSSDSSISIMRRETELFYDDKCSSNDLRDINSLYGGN